MEKKATIRSEIDRHLLDHPFLRKGLKSSGATLVIVFSAFIFAFGYKCFLVPVSLVEDCSSGHPAAIRLVSGGFSGVSQLLVMIVSLFPGVQLSATNENILYSVLYFGLNVPLFLLSWKGIGKRFTILTLLNVGLTSAFTNILGIWDYGRVAEIAAFANSNGGMLTRALFAAACTGVSSGVAFKVDASAGGVDVISYLIALKKSVLVGKYSVLINGVTITLFAFFGSLKIWLGQLQPSEYISSMQYVTGAFFSAFYLFATALVIDAINLRNKKMKIEVISANKDLAKIVISALPHGATVLKGEGAYTGQTRYVVEIVVSSYETKEAVKVIRETDPAAFVQVSELHQVYGRFFIPPVR